MYHTTTYHDVDGIPQTCKPSVYMVDFSHAEEYLSDGKHVEQVDNVKFNGQPRYASVSKHKGFSQSRKDDLESIGYVLMHLLLGKKNLPWMGQSRSHTSSFETIMKYKELPLKPHFQK